MLNKKILSLIMGLVASSLLSTGFAINAFSILPYKSLPTQVIQGGPSVQAVYQITNKTTYDLPGNFVQMLPKNVTVSKDGCGDHFTLKAGGTCLLNLNISGTVVPEETLNICLANKFSCDQPAVSDRLKVNAIALDKIVLSSGQTQEIPAGTQIFFQATGYFKDGNTADLRTLTDATHPLTFASSDPTVASIDSNGTLTGNKEGDVKVTVSWLSGLDKKTSNELPIKVIKATLISIDINTPPLKLVVGQPQMFKATGHFSDKVDRDLTNSVKWGVSDANKVKVEQGTGKVTALINSQSEWVNASDATITSPQVKLNIQALPDYQCTDLDTGQQGQNSYQLSVVKDGTLVVTFRNKLWYFENDKYVRGLVLDNTGAYPDSYDIAGSTISDKILFVTYTKEQDAGSGPDQLLVSYDLDKILKDTTKTTIAPSRDKYQIRKYYTLPTPSSAIGLGAGPVFIDKANAKAFVKYFDTDANYEDLVTLDLVNDLAMAFPSSSPITRDSPNFAQAIGRFYAYTADKKLKVCSIQAGACVTYAGSALTLDPSKIALFSYNTVEANSFPYLLENGSLNIYDSQNTLVSKLSVPVDGTITAIDEALGGNLYFIIQDSGKINHLIKCTVRSS